MPTQPYTQGELAESTVLLELVGTLLQDGDESDEDLADDLIPFLVEPLQRRLLQDIGSEGLSLERLRREAAQQGFNSDDRSANIYATFGFHLDWLPRVVAALDPPEEFKTAGGHVFSGLSNAIGLGALMAARRAP